MQAKIKTKNGKELQLQILVDSGYTYTRIDQQLVKEEQIKTKPADVSFEIFNANSIRNREVTRFVPLKIKINVHKKQIDAVVTEINGTDMFLKVG